MIGQIEGILDRGAFTDRLKQILKAEETVTVAVLDGDQFAELNEQGGREAGDRLLLLVAEVLVQEGTTHNWVVSRLGGDEFAIAMPGTSLERGFLQMEGLRASLASLAAEALPEFKPTFSIGVANYPRDAKDQSGLMRQADQALYAAKESERNSVGLPSREEMVLRSCYYTTAQLGRLKKLAEQLNKKEAVLLREALDDLLRKYDVK